MDEDLKYILDTAGLEIKKIKGNGKAYNVNPIDPKISRETAYAKFQDLIDKGILPLENAEYLRGGNITPVYDTKSTTPIVRFSYNGKNYRFDFKDHPANDSKSKTDSYEQAFIDHFLLVVRTSEGKGALDSDWDFSDEELTGIEDSNILGYKKIIERGGQVLFKYLNNVAGLTIRQISSLIISRDNFSSDDNISLHKKIRGLRTERSDLFTGNRMTDTWNPSDLYMIKEDQVGAFLEEWKKCVENPNTNLFNFDKILYDYQSRGVLFGVSLKNAKSGASIIPAGYLSSDRAKRNPGIVNNQIFIPLLNKDVLGSENRKYMNFDIDGDNISFIKIEYRTSGDDFFMRLSTRSSADYQNGDASTSLLNKWLSKYKITPANKVVATQENISSYAPVFEMALANFDIYCTFKKTIEKAETGDFGKLEELMTSLNIEGEEYNYQRRNFIWLSILKFLQLLNNLVEVDKKGKSSELKKFLNELIEPEDKAPYLLLH